VGEDTIGNNLSNPVLFPEGHGLLGLPVSDALGNRIYENTGFRLPTDETIMSLPYDNLPDSGGPFLQADPNYVWQAVWEDRSSSPVPVTVDWSDNLVKQQWTTQSVVRVEVVLSDLLQDATGPVPGDPLTTAQLRQGYEMQSLGGTKKEEVWATTGDIVDLNPTVYSIVPRLKIQKLDGEDGNIVATIFDEAVHESFGVEGPGGFGAEVNAAGKVIYGYNWNLRNVNLPDKEGWYRLNFSLDDHADIRIEADEETPGYEALDIPRNTELANLHPLDLNPVPGAIVPAAVEDGETVMFEPVLASNTLTYLDIELTTRRTGRKPTNPGGGETLAAAVPEPSTLTVASLALLLLLGGRSGLRRRVG
jgi:hypothetical protein